MLHLGAGTQLDPVDRLSTFFRRTDSVAAPEPALVLHSSGYLNIPVDSWKSLTDAAFLEQDFLICQFIVAH